MPQKAKEVETGYRMSFKYRIYPTQEQIDYFNLNFDATRFVYNVFLRRRIDAYEKTRETVRRPRVLDDGETWARDENGKVIYDEVPNESYDPEAKPLSFFDTSRQLTQLKKEAVDQDGVLWLVKADSSALIYALRNLDAAYQGFFRSVKKGGNSGFPKFKKRGGHHAFKIPGQKVKLTAKEGERFAYLKIPKLSPVKLRYHRPIEGEIVSCTISGTSSGKYYASINVKGVEREPLPASGDAVGITLGVSEWVVTSDGEVVENPRHRKKMRKKLARAQRTLSRRRGAKKGEEKSKRFLKQQAKIKRIEERIARQRENDTHNLTHALIEQYGTIVSREMSTQDMMADKSKKSWKINESLADANFFEINRQLAYKGVWAGRNVVIVPKDYPTAQICHACGYKHTILADDLRPTWTCPNCGKEHHRKLNGAYNVLEAGLDIISGEPSAAVSRDVAECRKADEEKRTAE